MENKTIFTKILRIAVIEYYKWIINPRMIIAVAMLIFIQNFAVSPLLKISEEMNCKLNTLEPFIAILNSKVLCLVTPAVYLFLISDYPKMDKKSLFVLIRIKKSEWIIGQFLFFVISSFTYLISILICSTLPNLFNSQLCNNWSRAITNYGIVFQEKASSFSATLITPELYNQISPIKTVLIGFFITIFYMITIAMILLLFYIINLKKLGIIISISVISIGSAFGIIKSNEMWFFPMAHTMISLHYTDYFKEPIMKIQNSFLYFIIIILIIMTICFLAVKKTNFLNNDENE